MLYAAMGPSPWQNLDNPDDVNVDGWTTPMDALLIINPVNEGVSLSALTAAPASLFVDVNGDRILDANDAIQVINTLNAASEAPIAADAARRMAPLWYDGNVTDDAAWQDTDSAEQSEAVEGDAKLVTEDAPLAVAIFEQRDESLDSGGVAEEKPKAEVDDELFSEDVDWLLEDVI
jgi:hypothetical protein